MFVLPAAQTSQPKRQLIVDLSGEGMALGVVED
jgi:hypothetical protein